MTQTEELRPSMIEVAGLVYNRDHIVKVDLTKPEMVVIHTTTGADSYDGETGHAIRRFFSPPAPPQAEAAKKAKRA